MKMMHIAGAPSQVDSSWFPPLVQIRELALVDNALYAVIADRDAQVGIHAAALQQRSGVRLSVEHIFCRLWRSACADGARQPA